jgi:hypothetical protein
MELKIHRLEYNDKQTIGAMQVIDGNDVLFSCWTLELPDLENRSRISCIPSGIYSVKKRTSPKHKEHFHITNVPNRSYILIHSGNYHSDILGCILVGSNFKDINKDGYADVINSKATLKKLLAILPDEFELTIA